MRHVRRRSLAAAVLAGLTLAACGADSQAPKNEADPVGEVRVGSVAQLAKCSDWNEGSRAERLATIADIRSQVNLQDGTVRMPALSNEAAYEVFDNTCAKSFAGGFRLYKVYARAASFAPLVNR